MAWVFPGGKLPVALSIADYAEVNKNLQPYIDLFTGGFNEHNLSEDIAGVGGWSVASDFSNNTAWRVDLIEEEASDYASAGETFEETAWPIPDDDLYRSGAGWQRVRGLEWAGVVRGNALRVLANIQASQTSVNGDFPTYSATGRNDTNSYLGSARFCLEIDGAPIPETTYGDADDNQGPWMEHGVRLSNVAEIDAILPTSPGYHTVRVLVLVDRMSVPQAGETCVAIGRATMFTWELD